MLSRILVPKISRQHSAIELHVKCMEVASVKMKLFWHMSFERFEPCCETSLVNRDGIDLLACLLLDDGGCGLETTLKWIDEGLSRTDDAISAQTESLCWDRETWGAMISLGGVEIYSLLDENVCMDLDLKSFQTALSEWKKFIMSEPKAQGTKHIAM